MNSNGPHMRFELSRRQQARIAAEAIRAAAERVPAVYQRNDSPSAWLDRYADELEAIANDREEIPDE